MKRVATCPRTTGLSRVRKDRANEKSDIYNGTLGERRVKIEKCATRHRGDEQNKVVAHTSHGDERAMLRPDHRLRHRR